MQVLVFAVDNPLVYLLWCGVIWVVSYDYTQAIAEEVQRRRERSDGQD